MSRCRGDGSQGHRRVVPRPDGETAADVRTILQGLLMKRERSKRRDGVCKLVNVDLYKFAFESGTSWVKLVR